MSEVTKTENPIRDARPDILQPKFSDVSGTQPGAAPKQKKADEFFQPTYDSPTPTPPRMENVIHERLEVLDPPKPAKKIAPPTVKMLLALQLCHLDYARGFELARAIAAMQPEKCEHTEFWLFFSKKVGSGGVTKLPRYEETVKALQLKFGDVQAVVCRRDGEGYPHGPADMWFDLLNTSFLRRRSQQLKAECMLTFEYDCVPVGVDWHYRLREEWRVARAKDKYLTGAYSACEINGKSYPHINGNMVIATDVLKYMPRLIGCPSQAAWDVYFGEYLIDNGQVSELIHNEYRCPTISKENLFKERNGVLPAMIHGIRDDSGIRILEAEHRFNVA